MRREPSLGYEHLTEGEESLTQAAFLDCSDAGSPRDPSFLQVTCFSAEYIPFLLSFKNSLYVLETSPLPE